jgi:hypothetical protein
LRDGTTQGYSRSFKPLSKYPVPMQKSMALLRTCPKGEPSFRALPFFQENDEAIVQLFLPPEMTGQQSTLILNGPAVVKRIDKKRYGIAVQFQKALKAFEVST